MFTVLLTLSVIGLSSASDCDQPHFEKCICGERDYLNKRQYVMNCTDKGFKNASMLASLPPQTQVLIFTGNDIPELPWNVFGTTNNFSELKVVDMSHNNIQEIRGKTYHRVPKVERLILNHNQISISSSKSSTKGTNHHHPRVFSNFESLVELHLTNAFADNSPEDLAADLHDIFINSDLSKLKKLHLEQNEISHFKDPKVFCELTDLLDLHLSNNKLTTIDFDIECLSHLRFIDLEANAITHLSNSELSALDTLPLRSQNLMIDLSENSFQCGCELQEFYLWLQHTKVEVRNKNKLKCKHTPFETNQRTFVMNPEHPHCPQKLKQAIKVCEMNSSATMGFLSLALVLSLALLVYTNRLTLQAKLIPLFHTLTRKVRYTTIGKQEVQEMDV